MTVSERSYYTRGVRDGTWSGWRMGFLAGAAAGVLVSVIIAALALR